MQTSRSFNWYTRMWRAWITQPFNSTVTYGQLNMLHLKSVGELLVVPYGGSNIFLRTFFLKKRHHHKFLFFLKKWFNMLIIRWTLKTCFVCIRHIISKFCKQTPKIERLQFSMETCSFNNSMCYYTERNISY